MTEGTPYRHRFPLSYRDVQDLLHQRGTLVSHETLREWCIKFGPLFAADLRHREPRRGSQWYLDEMCTAVDGVRHWLWRAVDEYGFVLDILLQQHRDTQAAKTLLTRLLGEYDVPEVIHTDQLQSYGAAIRQIPSLADVDHQQVISKARCHHIVEQEHRSTRPQERSQQCFRRHILSLHTRITKLHHHSRTSVCAAVRRSHQKRAFQTESTVAAGMA
ncbi:IS6 family transposase [Deinococcus saxicola]|uniref:IS6 family transposase n=1 Tax=Deinococcus saxicola TaxID=249406 RepID=UPI0039EE686D